jgi:hypothetical protein
MIVFVTVLAGPPIVAVVVTVVGSGAGLVRTLTTVTVMVTVRSAGGGVLLSKSVMVLVSRTVFVVKNRTVTVFWTVSVTRTVERAVPGFGQLTGPWLEVGVVGKTLGSEAEQTPKAGLQLEPQWSSVFPHLAMCQAYS